MRTARLLHESGIERCRAEAITTAIKEAVINGTVTKADLSGMEAEIKAKLQWIKAIGGIILAVLLLSWLPELILAASPS